MHSLLSMVIVNGQLCASTSTNALSAEIAIQHLNVLKKRMGPLFKNIFFQKPAPSEAVKNAPVVAALSRQSESPGHH